MGYGIASMGMRNYCENYRNANGKYKNVYNQGTTYKPNMIGDAISDTSGWHSGSAQWYTTRYDCIVRAYSGSIFSYNARSHSNSDVGYYMQKHYSRAAMVCGEGI